MCSAEEDYLPIGPLLVAFGPEQTARNVSIEIVDDERTEYLTESVIISIFPITSGVQTTTEPSLFDIIDDDCKYTTVFMKYILSLSSPAHQVEMLSDLYTGFGPAS